MTWEELCEKAKEMGYKVFTNCACERICCDYFNKLCFYKTGMITVFDVQEFIDIADHRTPDQMYQIMKALQ